MPKINSMKDTSYSEGDNCLASQEISCLLWNLKVHCCEITSSYSDEYEDDVFWDVAPYSLVEID
jgi:hypothetical protein